MLWYRDILSEQLLQDRFIFETFLITYITHARAIKSEMAHDNMKVNDFTFSLLIKAALLKCQYKTL